MMPSREAWLGRLVDALRPDFAGHGCPLPERIRVACGWPSRGGRAARRKTIGEAWSSRCSSDGAFETFLSPVMADPIEVGAVLVHELVHHAVGTDAGHRGPFRRLALAVGLKGPMRSTTAGDELRRRLHGIVEAIGPYPHAALNASDRKRQPTRMLKVGCAACGCVIRMTRQWIASIGTPTCACGCPMQQVGA